MNEVSLNAKCRIEGLSSFQSVFALGLAYRNSFSLQVALVKHILFFNWDKQHFFSFGNMEKNLRKNLYKINSFYVVKEVTGMGIMTDLFVYRNSTRQF